MHYLHRNTFDHVRIKLARYIYERINWVVVTLIGQIVEQNDKCIVAIAQNGVTQA